jgi:hypothetical protein
MLLSITRGPAVAAGGGSAGGGVAGGGASTAGSHAAAKPIREDRAAMEP